MIALGRQASRPVTAVALLSAGQVILLLSLMGGWHSASLFAVLLGVGLTLVFVTLACHWVCRWTGSYGSGWRTAAMVAAGGFGMLAGCLADLGQLGLYGLIALCQSLPSLEPWSLEPLWQRMRWMPWTYAGMLLGGGLGMWLWGFPAGTSWSRRGSRILWCSLGMLVGMLTGEAAALALLGFVSPHLAGAVMALAMLACMNLGMLLPLVAEVVAPRPLSPRMNP